MNSNFISFAFYSILCFLIIKPVSAGAQNADFSWVNPIGGPGATTVSGYDYRARTVEVDQQFVYNVGNFSGIVDFDPGAGTSTLDAAAGSLFIVKYDTAGSFIWVKQFGNTTPGAEATALVTDTAGNIYIGGFFHSGTPFDLDPGTGTALVTSNGSADIFTIKLDANGDYVWGDNFGSSGYDRLNGMTSDRQGNIYAIGNYNSPIHFSRTSLSGTLSGYGCYVLKMNPAGGLVWVRSWIGEGYGIAVDDGGDVITCGNFGHYNTSLRVDFNPGTGPADTFYMTSNSSMDLYISKLTGSGDFVWAKQIGGPLQDQCFSLATDKAGSIYATGIFCSTVDFDPGPGVHEMTSGGVAVNLDVDAFVLKLDASGNFCWSRQTYGTGSNWGWSLEVGQQWSSGLYFAGVCRGRTDFCMGNDTVQFASIGGQYFSEGFLLKLDTSGNLQWAKQMGSTGTNSVKTDDYGGVYTSGWFDYPTTDMDPGPAVHTVLLTGVADGFVHKISQCLPSRDIVDTSCGPYEFGGVTYYESGVYEVENLLSCESGEMMLLDLTIYILEPEIDVDRNMIFPKDTFSSYQWYRDGVLIPGETNRIYTVTDNASYTVEVSNGRGCKVMSPPYVVNNIGIRVVDRGGLISVYPNPVNDILYVKSTVPLHAKIMSMDGKLLVQRKVEEEISLSGLSQGNYLLYLYDDMGTPVRIQQIVKQ